MHYKVWKNNYPFLNVNYAAIYIYRYIYIYHKCHRLWWGSVSTVNAMETLLNEKWNIENGTCCAKCEITLKQCRHIDTINQICNRQTQFNDRYRGISVEFAAHLLVNAGSGNGLMLTENNSLSISMLTKFHVTKYHRGKWVYVLATVTFCALYFN